MTPLSGQEGRLERSPGRSGEDEDDHRRPYRRRRRLRGLALVAVAATLLLTACQQPAEQELPLGRSAAMCGPYLAASGLADALDQGVRKAAPHATAVPVPGELLIAYRPPQTSLLGPATLDGRATAGLSPAALVELTGAAVRSDFGLTRLEMAALPGLPELVATDDAPAVLAKLSDDPRVEYAHLNYYLEVLYVPADPLYEEQWHLDDFGLASAWDAYLAVSSQREVVIAIIDTGVDPLHPDLATKVLPGWDFHGVDPDAAPGTGYLAGHGTHVAGIAAAAGGAVGVTGVAFVPEVRLLPVKVFDDSGAGGTVADLVRAIRWSAGLSVAGAPGNRHPAQVINLSIGVPGVFPSLDAAVKAAWDAGAVVVAAAGNHAPGQPDRGVLSPANAPCAIAVGSVDADRQVSAFSNTGPEVEILAPGGYGSASCGGIVSTMPGGGYGCMSGTSMATPFAAGVAALVLSQGEHTSPESVRNLFSVSTSSVDSYLPTVGGHGLLCADMALGAATSCGRLVLAPSAAATTAR